MENVPKHLRAKLRIEGECWIWTGPKNNKGYGRATGRYTHRLVYEALKGPIPDGLELDHLCRTPLCANPDHLEAVRHSTNLQRSKACKLSADDVAEIRKLRELGYSNRQMAALFGVHRSHVSRVCNRLKWADVS